MKLDHVVYFTNGHLTEIVGEQKQNGYDAMIGGRHEQWGTANALLYTNNAYVEWLTIEDKEQAVKAAANQPLVAQFLHDRQYGDGWAMVCFSVDQMDEWKEELDNKGFQTTDILSASRRTKDGQLLHWRMLFVDQAPTSELPYPFFIEWAEPKDQAVIQSAHKELQITECIFHVEDPLRETGEWAVLLSQKVGEENDIRIGDILFRFVEKQDVPERLAVVRFSDNG